MGPTLPTNKLVGTIAFDNCLLLELLRIWYSVFSCDESHAVNADIIIKSMIEFISILFFHIIYFQAALKVSGNDGLKQFHAGGRPPIS